MSGQLSLWDRESPYIEMLLGMVLFIGVWLIIDGCHIWSHLRDWAMEGPQGESKLWIVFVWKLIMIFFKILKDLWKFEAWLPLQVHVDDIKRTHLRDLMSDTERCKSMMVYAYYLYYSFISIYFFWSACTSIWLENIVVWKLAIKFL